MRSKPINNTNDELTKVKVKRQTKTLESKVKPQTKHSPKSSPGKGRTIKEVKDNGDSTAITLSEGNDVSLSAPEEITIIVPAAESKSDLGLIIRNTMIQKIKSRSFAEKNGSFVKDYQVFSVNGINITTDKQFEDQMNIVKKSRKSCKIVIGPPKNRGEAGTGKTFIKTTKEKIRIEDESDEKEEEKEEEDNDENFEQSEEKHTTIYTEDEEKIDDDELVEFQQKQEQNHQQQQLLQQQQLEAEEEIKNNKTNTVHVVYEMFDQEFPTKDPLSSNEEKLEDEYALKFVMPGCSIHLSESSPIERSVKIVKSTASPKAQAQVTASSSSSSSLYSSSSLTLMKHGVQFMPVDIQEDDIAYYFQAEVPSVTKDQISLDLTEDDHLFTIGFQREKVSDPGLRFGNSLFNEDYKDAEEDDEDIGVKTDLEVMLEASLAEKTGKVEKLERKLYLVETALQEKESELEEAKDKYNNLLIKKKDLENLLEANLIEIEKKDATAMAAMEKNMRQKIQFDVEIKNLYEALEEKNVEIEKLKKDMNGVLSLRADKVKDEIKQINNNQNKKHDDDDKDKTNSKISTTEEGETGNKNEMEGEEGNGESSKEAEIQNETKTKTETETETETENQNPNQNQSENNGKERNREESKDNENKNQAQDKGEERRGEESKENEYENNEKSEDFAENVTEESKTNDIDAANNDEVSGKNEENLEDSISFQKNKNPEIMSPKSRSLKQISRQQERLFGKMERSFHLDQKADADRISAKLSFGVLSIIIPKMEKQEKKRIKIMGPKGKNEQDEKIIENERN